MFEKLSNKKIKRLFLYDKYVRSILLINFKQLFNLYDEMAIDNEFLQLFKIVNHLEI